MGEDVPSRPREESGRRDDPPPAPEGSRHPDDSDDDFELVTLRGTSASRSKDNTQDVTANKGTSTGVEPSDTGSARTVRRRTPTTRRDDAEQPFADRASSASPSRSVIRRLSNCYPEISAELDEAASWGSVRDLLRKYWADFYDAYTTDDPRRLGPSLHRPETAPRPTSRHVHHCPPVEVVDPPSQSVTACHGDITEGNLANGPTEPEFRVDSALQKDEEHGLQSFAKSPLPSPKPPRPGEGTGSRIISDDLDLVPDPSMIRHRALSNLSLPTWNASSVRENFQMALDRLKDLLPLWSIKYRDFPLSEAEVYDFRLEEWLLCDGRLGLLKELERAITDYEFWEQELAALGTKTYHRRFQKTYLLPLKMHLGFMFRYAREGEMRRRGAGGNDHMGHRAFNEHNHNRYHAFDVLWLPPNTLHRPVCRFKVEEEDISLRGVLRWVEQRLSPRKTQEPSESSATPDSRASPPSAGPSTKPRALQRSSDQTRSSARPDSDPSDTTTGDFAADRPSLGLQMFYGLGNNPLIDSIVPADVRAGVKAIRAPSQSWTGPLQKDATGHARLSYRRGEMTLGTVIASAPSTPVRPARSRNRESVCDGFGPPVIPPRSSSMHRSSCDISAETTVGGQGVVSTAVAKGETRVC